MRRRFVVRELEGYRIRPSSNTGRHSKYGKGRPPGLTVWVGDEALNGKEVRVWRSEEMPSYLAREWKREACRREARQLAARLNAADRLESQK